MSIRVLHVVESLVPQAGAVAVTLPGLFQALLRADIAISCLVAEKQPSEAGTAHLNNSEASLAKNLKLFGHGQLQRALTNADVVHIHGWHTPLTQPVVSNAGKLGIPVVLAPLGALCDSPFRYKSFRERMRNLLPSRGAIRGVTVLAAMHEQEAIGLSGQDDRIETLPYGLDAARFSSSSSKARPASQTAGKLALYLGPIDPAEGVVMLLKSFAELGSVAQTWHITLAGPRVGDWRSQLETAIDRKGAEDRVRFVDAPDVATQQSWIENADLVIAPSLCMCFPLTAMQAACLGAPVLATTLATPDSLTGTIRTCPPARGEFKMALREILEEDDGMRSSAAKVTQTMAREKFDWAHCAERFVQLYRSLV